MPLENNLNLDRTYTYQEISLVPRVLSHFRTRSAIDLSTELKIGAPETKLKMPILPAPMDTICSVDMCEIFYQNGMLGMIHRFQSIKKRIADYSLLQKQNTDAFIAVGLEEINFIEKIYKQGARFFIIDVANGFNTHIEPIIKFIKDLENTFVICGNVASREGFQYLSDLGTDAIRVGIGNGSMCTTSVMTGVGQGIVSAILECKQQKQETNSNSLIIADGGIVSIGDIAKALALGADLVMMGRIFAGTKEAEGNILKYNGKLYKAYRGSASFAVQQKHRSNPYYVEGDETIVNYKGSAQNILEQIDAGLRSAFSYMGAGNVQELRKYANFVHYVMDNKLFKTS